MTKQPIVQMINVIVTCAFCIHFMWMTPEDEAVLRFYGIHSFVLLLLTSHTCTTSVPYSDHDMLMDCMFVVFGLGSHAYVALIIEMELNTICSALFMLYCLITCYHVVLHVQSLPVVNRKERKRSDAEAVESLNP